MTPRKLDLLIACPAYGGNGGIASLHPDVAQWLIDVHNERHVDPYLRDRIGRLATEFHSDTPITMVRNRYVQQAKQGGFDILLMVDSDQSPDCELGCDPDAKPFFRTSFEFLYEHYERGPTCVFAPYCGPPPVENVYVFDWTNCANSGDEVDMQITQYSRREAARMTGIQPAASGPTGLIMTDVRCYDLYGPPHFDYEWPHEKACPHCHTSIPGIRAEKASTEDCYALRDLSLCGMHQLGYNPVHCNWDAWAGHWKPLNVRKPRPLTLEQVGRNYLNAAKSPSGRLKYERLNLPIPNGAA